MKPNTNTAHATNLDPRRPGPSGGKLQCYQDGEWLDDWTAGCPVGNFAEQGRDAIHVCAHACLSDRTDAIPGDERDVGCRIWLDAPIVPF